MKKLMNLKSAKMLSKVEQKSINGGVVFVGSCTIACDSGVLIHNVPN